jgi:hypothetical protein
MTASSGADRRLMPTARTARDEHASCSRSDSADTEDTRDGRPSRQGHAARDPTPRFRSAVGPHPALLRGLTIHPRFRVERVEFVKDEFLFSR